MEFAPQLGLPLLVHGEVVEQHVDIFDREKQFLLEKLAPLQAKMPELKVVLEHATTKEAVEYVLSNPSVGCTITPQHLLYNRNALFVGGLKPHFYCLPILKREVHRTSIHPPIHPSGVLAIRTSSEWSRCLYDCGVGCCEGVVAAVEV